MEGRIRFEAGGIVFADVRYRTVKNRAWLIKRFKKVYRQIYKGDEKFLYTITPDTLPESVTLSQVRQNGCDRCYNKHFGNNRPDSMDIMGLLEHVECI